MKSKDGTYLTVVYDPNKPSGTQCDMTVKGTTEASKATPFKFEKKKSLWIISVDCDKDGKWTSFLSEDPADLIQTREKDKAKVKRQRWRIKCTAGRKCVLKNKLTSKPFGTQWSLKKVNLPTNRTNVGTPSPTSPGGKWIKTNITYYGQDAADDNGKGVIGVDLFKIGSSGNNCSLTNQSACKGPPVLKFNGKPVYPIAVHHDDAEKYLYKIMEIKGGSKVTPGFLGVVVDICNRVHSSCSNVNANGLKFLVDIHKTGFVASGNNNNGQDMFPGETRVVGSITPKDIPKDAWLKGSWFLCKCTGKCDTTQNQTWMDPKDPSKCIR
jgi:hypothetical protein